MEGHTNIYEYCESNGQDFCLLVCRKREDSSSYFGSPLYMDQSRGAFSVREIPDEAEEETIVRKSEEFIKTNLFSSFTLLGPRQPGRPPFVAA